MDTTLPAVSFITPYELASHVGRPEAPLILDVRPDAGFALSQVMLAGARRCALEAIQILISTEPAGAVVVYCNHGHERSLQAAAALNLAGWRASALAGGLLGGEDGVDSPQAITSWRAQRKPLMRKRPDLGVTGEQVSRWITRERPRIDRVACPWLIRRFIDPRAEFIYVPTGNVLDEAQRRNAVAYDIPGGAISHEGELCSFDALMRAFDLQFEGLDVLANIVRGADTDHLDLAPQCAGLLALSLGLSTLHAQDDQAMLEAAMPLYDALYAWSSLQSAGKSEGHSWKPESMIT